MAVKDQLSSHMELLKRRLGNEDISDIQTTPIFTPATRDGCKDVLAENEPFPQYGLLAGNALGNSTDNRLFFNTTAPNSVFICGSQGSGKSHTLSCLLENCLLMSRASVLSKPLTAIVFHHDTFASEKGGAPCEAAYLASNAALKVKVLCAPTNIRNIKKIYKPLGNIKVEELKPHESDLNTQRMFDLMALSGSGSKTLYLDVVGRILREIRLQQQERGSPFNYHHFIRMLEAAEMQPQQRVPLRQRLDTLESFMVADQVKPGSRPVGKGNHPPATTGKNHEWTPKSGHLTIIDLSCPCVTPETACSLFNICLSLFLEQPTTIGRAIALDEAHKYMTNTPEAGTLTENLLSCIRLQRHIAARVFIATQEPTISPALLDLCSVTIVHRFSSPAWLEALKKHLAGVSAASMLARKAAELDRDDKMAFHFNGPSTLGPNHENMIESLGKLSLLHSDKDVATLRLSTTGPVLDLFSKIVGLRVGEALVFAPSAVLSINTQGRG